MSNFPNIVILHSDQHNANALGCYGNSEVITPNLDRLAGEGVAFNRAYTQNPICSPSRISMLTGQYVHNFGYYGLDGELPAGYPNILSHLKKSGYRNGIVGKIHTPKTWLSKDCDFVRDIYGFENADGHCDYTNYLKEKGLLHLRDDLYLPEWVEKMKDCDPSVERPNNCFPDGQGLDARPSDLYENDTPEGWAAAESIKFIEKSKGSENPFCLWVSFPRPHQVYTPAKKFWDMYEGKQLSLPPNADDDLNGRPPNVQRMKKYQKVDCADWIVFEPNDYKSARKRVLRGYYACITQVDDAVGQIINKIEELGLKDDTIIIYTTDHGDFCAEHGLVEKAPGIGFHSITRVPFIWSWKGKIPKNQVKNELVELVDLVPTVCRLAGLEIPNYCDGLDMYSLLKGESGKIRDMAVTENVLSKSVHTEKYKYTYYEKTLTGNTDFGELYDLETDPWELKNLYFELEYSSVVYKLKGMLLDWLIRTTRFVSVWPSIPDQPVYEHNSNLNAEDGKLGFNFLKELISKKLDDYL